MIRYPYSVYIIPYVVISDGKVKAMVRALRTVHASLDPTKYTEMLETLFHALTITPQQQLATHLFANLPVQTQPYIQISSMDAFYSIQFFM
jgi:hypothetical protein